MPLLWLSGVIIERIDLGCAGNLMGVLIGWQLHYCCSWPTDDVDPHSLTPWSPTRLPTRRSCAEPRRGVVQEQQLGPFHHWFREIVTAPQNSDHNRKFMRPMAKETHIKTDKKPVGGWGAWELRNLLNAALSICTISWLTGPQNWEASNKR